MYHRRSTSRMKKTTMKKTIRLTPYRSDPRMQCAVCERDLTPRSAWGKWDNPPGPDPPAGPQLITPADVMAHPERGRLPADEAESVCAWCAPVGRSIPWAEMVKLRARRFATGMTLEAVDRELERLGALWADKLRQARG